MQRNVTAVYELTKLCKDAESEMRKSLPLWAGKISAHASRSQMTPATKLRVCNPVAPLETKFWCTTRPLRAFGRAWCEGEGGVSFGMQATFTPLTGRLFACCTGSRQIPSARRLTQLHRLDAAGRRDPRSAAAPPCRASSSSDSASDSDDDWDARWSDFKEGLKKKSSLPKVEPASSARPMPGALC